jgi:glucoamylase
MVKARIHWTNDDWKTFKDADTIYSGLGIHYADLPAANPSPANKIIFTFYWPEAGSWEGKDFTVEIED